MTDYYNNHGGEQHTSYTDNLNNKNKTQPSMKIKDNGVPATTAETFVPLLGWLHTRRPRTYTDQTRITAEIIISL